MVIAVTLRQFWSPVSSFLQGRTEMTEVSAQLSHSGVLGWTVGNLFEAQGCEEGQSTPSLEFSPGQALTGSIKVKKKKHKKCICSSGSQCARTMWTWNLTSAPSGVAGGSRGLSLDAPPSSWCSCPPHGSSGLRRFSQVQVCAFVTSFLEHFYCLLQLGGN